MKVLITSNAYNDIKEYYIFSKSSEKVKICYITSLLKFIKDLGVSPEMGKYSFDLKLNSKRYNIRKLIYKQHKILYYVNDCVHIVGIIHTKMNQNEYIKKLKNSIKL